ncbi:MAG: MFS transporter [Rhizobiaceae bacterium]|nr:MAG: MFS transporter [Rhizobiaceae bacterium]
MTTEAKSGEGTQFPPLTWGVKLLILAGAPAVGLGISGPNIILPTIEAELAHGEFDKLLVKMLIGVTGAAMVIGAPLTGFLADRLGLRKVLFFNYALFTIAGSAGLYLSDLWLLTLSRFLVGIAGAGAVTASIIIINKRVDPDARASWMGAYITASYVCNIVLHPAMGFLGEQNWHLVFAPFLLFAPFALLALTSFSGPEPIVKADAGSPTVKEEPLLSWFPARYAVLGFMMGCIVYLPIVYMPFMMRDLGITNPKDIGFIMLGDTLAGIVVSMMFGRSRRYMSVNGNFMFAFATTAIGGAITAMAQGYWTVMLGMGIVGMGVGWFMPTLMYLIGTKVLPVQQGRTAGLVKGSNYLATPLVILAVQPLYLMWGPRFPILLSGLVSLALLIGVIWLIVQERGRERLAVSPAE